MEKIKKKYSKTDCLILGIGFLILGLFVLSIAIPIVYVVLASFQRRSGRQGRSCPAEVPGISHQDPAQRRITHLTEQEVCVS